MNRNGAVLAAILLLACAEATPVSQEILVRLNMPLITTSRQGTRFEAVVTGCARADCTPLLPAGSTVHGYLAQVQAVGLGLKRERASLRLSFDGCYLPDGTAINCRSELVDLDNARESVSKGNRIHGILAANHPPQPARRPVDPAQLRAASPLARRHHRRRPHDLHRVFAAPHGRRRHRRRPACHTAPAGPGDPYPRRRRNDPPRQWRPPRHQ